MATATIRPDGTDYGGGALTGGAGSTHATLADNSDGTYVSKAAGSPADVVRMGTTTKPAGAILSTIQPWMKLQSSSGTTKANFSVPQDGRTAVTGRSVTSTPTVHYGPVVAVGDQSQAWIDALTMSFSTPSGGNTRFIEAGIDLVFPEPPTCVVTAPTGTVTSSTFAITWTHTPGTNGAGQSAYTVKIFTAAQYGSVGFDATTSIALYDSGITNSPSQGMTGILGAGTYRVYVRTAQVIGGTAQWSAWDSNDFTISLATAEVAAVTPALGVDGSIEIVVDFDAATDTADYAELDRSVGVDEWAAIGLDGTFESGSGGTSLIGGVGSVSVPAGFYYTTGGGGEPASPTSAIQNTPSPWNNKYWIIGGTFDAADRLTASPTRYIDVAPGDVVTVEAMIHSGLGANCEARMGISFVDEAEAIVAGNTEVAFPSFSAWKHYSHSLTAPPGARKASAQVSIFGNPGASGAACLLSIDNFRMERNQEWSAVRGAVDVTPAADQATYFDYEAPPGAEIRYRARAVKADGSLGDWVYMTDPSLTWTMTRGVWVKSIDDPNLNTLLRLAEAPDPVRPWSGVDIEIDGDPYPVTVTGTRGARRQQFIFRTNTAAEAAALEALGDEDIVVLHFPASVRIAPGYWSLKDIKERPMVRYGSFPYRDWVVDAVEVAAP